MKQKCMIAAKFPGLGPPGQMDIDEFYQALEYLNELADAHG